MGLIEPIRTTIMIEQETWDALGRFAHYVSVDEEQIVTKSELVRRACRREITEVLNNVYPQAKKP